MKTDRREFMCRTVAALGASVLGVRLFAAADEEMDSIVVRITYPGILPEGRVLDCSSDPICARTFKKEPLRDETIVVGKTGGLQNVFVYVAKGLPDKKWPIPDKPVVLDQDCRYLPHVFGVMAGQPLQIINSSKTLEVPHVFPRDNKEHSFKLNPGDKQIITFTKPEMTIRVKCDVHPWELAYCHVVPHPFYAATDDQGKCSIKGLQAGEYHLSFWHEKLGILNKTVEIKAGKPAILDDLTAKAFKSRTRVGVPELKAHSQSAPG